MLRCPHCGEVLSRSRVATIELDGCRSCGGTFFDAGELATLAREPQLLFEVERAFQPTQAPMAPRESHGCPKCHTAMIRREQPSLPGLPFDACPTCKGIWLNGGQARQLAKARGAVEAPPPAVPVKPSPPQSALEASNDPRHPTAAMFLGIGTLLLVMFTLTQSILAFNGDRAQARVVDVEHFRNRGSFRNGDWHATLQFQAGEKPVTIYEDLWALDHLLRTGDTVDVIYPRDRPELAMIDSFSRVWFVPLSFLVGGCLMTLTVYRKGFNLSFRWNRWWDD